MQTAKRAAFATRVLLSLAALVLLGLSGCGAPKFYSVRGKVIIFGVGALTEGEVRFQPISKPDLVASGKIGKDGTFTLSTPSHGDGVLEGPCRVAVLVEPKGGRPVIDDRFGDFNTSEIQCTVTAREENNFYIDVHRPGR